MSVKSILVFLALAAIASAHAPAGSTVYRDVTATHVPQAPDLHALDAALVDVDRDGDLDVAVAVEQGANRLYLNDGKGRLTWQQGAFGTAEHDSEHVLSADFDRDGFPDVIFVAEDDMAHSFYLGAPGGRFVDATSRLPARSEGNGLAVGDVNGDGLPDVVVGNSGERRAGRQMRPRRAACSSTMGAATSPSTRNGSTCGFRWRRARRTYSTPQATASPTSCSST